MPPDSTARTRAASVATAVVTLSIMGLFGRAKAVADGEALAVYRPNPAPARLLPAFPQAEGFGAYTPGGRGGKVYTVTTLEDSPSGQPAPAGSLRQAVEADGPRIVVFAVGGNITLRDELEVRNPYLTIAGQSAPGGGICLTGGGLVIATHDVILRHLRLRPAGKGSPDSLSLTHAQNVLVDHCSMSFSGDELLAATKQCSDLTVQWCFLSEGLDRRGHAQPVVLSGRRMSFHHNLIAHGDRCNPKVADDGPIDLRNNLIVNWRSQAAGGNAARVDLVANVFRPGIDTRGRGGPEATTVYWVHDSSPPACLHLTDNVLEGEAAGSADNWRLVAPASREQLVTMTPAAFAARYRAKPAFAAEEVGTDPPAEAAEKVLQFAGATLPRRDAIDARVAADVAAGTGRIINEADDAGGLAALAPGQPADDRDGDGMPNNWENRFGLNSHDPNDGPADKDGDGYTSVEEYLNGTDPRIGFPHVASPAVEPADGSIFLGSAKVTLTCPTPGAEIRYTLDGADPTQTSPLYAKPFSLDRTAVVRARAFAGMVASRMSYAELRKVSPCPPTRLAGLRPGLAYEYFELPEPTPQVPKPTWTVVRRDVVDRPRVDWIPAGAKAPRVDFIGYLAVPRGGLYTFTLSAPANCELWINGTQAILNDTGGDNPLQAIVALAAGHHAIKLHYATWTTAVPMKLLWQGPGLDQQEIPAEAFSHTEAK